MILLIAVLMTIAGYCKECWEPKHGLQTLTWQEWIMIVTRESSTFDCLVWVWSWHGPCTVGHCEPSSSSTLCPYAASQDNSCLEVHGGIYMVPIISAQGLCLAWVLHYAPIDRVSPIDMSQSIHAGFHENMVLMVEWPCFDKVVKLHVWEISIKGMGPLSDCCIRIAV